MLTFIQSDEPPIGRFGPLPADFAAPGQNARMEVIVKHAGNLDALTRDLGADVEYMGSGYAIVTLPYPLIPQLYNYREVEYVERSKNLIWLMRESLRVACIDRVHLPETFGLSGAGVLVAIIDSGIDYTHPDFRNPDGTTRIVYLWDQTLEGTPPEGFFHGAEFSAAQINEALNSPDPFRVVPSRDTLGHGTAVAGVAAGNGRASDGRERGVAFEASLIVVKLGERGRSSFARTTEFMRALKYVIDKADALSMPLAVNISFGTNDGSHDGLSLFETYLNDQAMRWKSVIAVATGNEGSAGHHYVGKAVEGVAQNIMFRVAPNLQSLYVTMWKNFVDTFGVEVFSPGRQTTGVVMPEQLLRVSNLEGAVVVVEYTQPTHYNEDQNIYIRIESRTENPIPPGLWRVRIRPERVVDGSFDLWLPTVEEVGLQTAFTEPDPLVTLTLPSTALGVISVGGYNQTIGATVGFSGRGFTRGSITAKPDLVAPAMNVITTAPGGGYDVLSGTSIAAPFVTGSAALMMQWGIVQGNDAFLYGQRAKAYLVKGAVQPLGQNLSFPDPYWGYGILCLNNAMEYLFQYTQGGTARL
jgi:minor extracellular serine protease Vpr